MGLHGSASSPTSRRAQRVRNTDAPNGSFTLLAVCTGNICRSPLAHSLLKARLSLNSLESAGVISELGVRSAGLQTVAGIPMDASAALEALRLGGDPAGLFSRPVTRALCLQSDLTLTMTHHQQVELVKRYPQVLRRTFVLREFARVIVESETVSSMCASPRSTLPEIVAAASAERVRLAIADNDVPDPYRQGTEVHRTVADLIGDAVDVICTKVLDGRFVGEAEQASLRRTL